MSAEHYQMWLQMITCDSDTLSIGPDASPNIPSDNDNTLSSQESTYDETETYEIIDELKMKIMSQQHQQYP